MVRALGCATLALPMMRAPHSTAPRPRLMPEGRRWGFGAHTVVPYLANALQARAGEDVTGSIRNPVFAQMEQALRALPGKA